MFERSIENIENRIARLSQKPVENAKLINKWKRALRRQKFLKKTPNFTGHTGNAVDYPN